jgi:hypothetical protein
LARTKSASSTPRSKRTDPVIDLKVLVNRLIAENKKLKTQIDKASSKASSTIVPRGLATLARRVERALAGTKTVKAVRKKPTNPRPPASPETIEKRRQALAKARSAMAEKRAASASRSDG